MAWFKRKNDGILTSTDEKLDVPDGIWNKCPSCKKPLYTSDLEAHHYLCSHCNYHLRIGSKEYFKIIFDDNHFVELDENLTSGDPLKFIDTKNYPERVKDTIAKTGLKDAMRTAHGKVEGEDLVICCMDFNFIGGSMGSVVGEKIFIFHKIFIKLMFFKFSKKVFLLKNLTSIGI